MSFFFLIVLKSLKSLKSLPTKNILWINKIFQMTKQQK